MAGGSYTYQAAPGWVESVGEDVRKAARAGLLSAAIRTVAHIKAVEIPRVSPHMPVDRGAYRAGWQAVAIPEGAHVYNSSPHAVFIEDGVKNVKPGKKMIDALTEWVKRKGIGSTVVTRKDGSKGVQKPSTTAARGIAFAIANSLKKKGIFNGGKGLGIFKRAEKLIPMFIEEEVAREIKRAFQ